MSNDNTNTPEAQPIAPPAAQIIITLHQDNRISWQFPTDGTLTLAMLGGFLQAISKTFKYEQPSSIIKPAPGMIIPPRG